MAASKAAPAGLGATRAAADERKGREAKEQHPACGEEHGGARQHAALGSEQRPQAGDEGNRHTHPREHCHPQEVVPGTVSVEPGQQLGRRRGRGTGRGQDQEKGRQPRGDRKAREQESVVERW